jgi:two-component system response regulator ResD
MVKAKARILLAEDDRDHQEGICAYLQEHGYHVSVASDGLRAIELVNAAELLVLDLGLPKVDGLEVLRRLRPSNSIPILILSGRSGGLERVQGLKSGADDYLVKPFILDELLARIEALLRRSRLPATSAPTTGPLVLDEDSQQVYLQGQPVNLSPKEFKLLRVLARTPQKTFSRDELLERVWGPEHWDSRRVNLYVSKLRAKLRRPGLPAIIQSVWGVGYKFAQLR